MTVKYKLFSLIFGTKTGKIVKLISDEFIDIISTMTHKIKANGYTKLVIKHK